MSAIRRGSVRFGCYTEATVDFTAFCGMSNRTREYRDPQEARDYVASIISLRRRQGMTVSRLVKGGEWEVREPETAAMVPDTAGIMTLDLVNPSTDDAADDGSDDDIDGWELAAPDDDEPCSHTLER